MTTVPEGNYVESYVEGGLDVTAKGTKPWTFRNCIQWAIWTGKGTSIPDAILST